MHQDRAVFLRRTRQRTHREGIDPERVERPALRVVHEVEPGTVDDDIGFASATARLTASASVISRVRCVCAATCHSENSFRIAVPS
jgi:hypothetical protein